MPRTTKNLAAATAALVALAACTSSPDESTGAESSVSAATATADTVATVAAEDPALGTVDVEVAETEARSAPTGADDVLVEPTSDDVSEPSPSSFRIDVWADNWMAVYVDGVLVGEDSVPITTERSFNSESFVFDASTPFTLAIEAKDFKETDSGLEYIGESNQQMGDGGLIAQVTDLSTGEVVAVTDAAWQTLVVHQAPLNPDCEDDVDPDATCQFAMIDTPSDWAASDFDDGAWTSATEWTAADVSPKQGYDDIAWDSAARLIWGADLEVDNTVLLRTTIL